MPLLELVGIERWQQLGDIVEAIAKRCNIRE